MTLKQIGKPEITMDQVKRKLTRNTILAKPIISKSKLDKLLGIQVYAYGNLYITVRWNKVIDIENHKGDLLHPEWKINKKLYIELSKNLGIESSKF